MLANHVEGSLILWNSSGDGLPRFAIVSSLEEINIEIVAAVAVERDIRRRGIVRRRKDAADVGAPGNSGDFSRDVLPGFTIAAHLHISIVGARPQNPRAKRRFTQRRDGWKRSHTVVAREHQTVLHFLAPDAARLALGTIGQIRTNPRPVVSLILGFDYAHAT